MTLSCEQVEPPARPVGGRGHRSGRPRGRGRASQRAAAACATRAACERTARDVLQRRRAALLAERAPDALRARIRADARAARRASGRERLAPAAGRRSLPRWCSPSAALTLHVATGRSTTLLAAQLAADHVKCHLTERDEGTVSPTEVQHRLAERLRLPRAGAGQFARTAAAAHRRPALPDGRGHQRPYPLPRSTAAPCPSTWCPTRRVPRPPSTCSGATPSSGRAIMARTCSWPTTARRTSAALRNTCSARRSRATAARAWETRQTMTKRWILATLAVAGPGRT